MLKKNDMVIKMFRCIYVPILYFFIMYMTRMVVESVLGTYSLPEEDAILALTPTMAALVMIPIALTLMKYDRKLGFCEKETEKTKTSVLVWIYIIIAAALVCIGLNIFINITGMINWGGGYEETAERIYNDNIFSIALGVGFLIPIVEELVFRGLVYERVRQYAGVIAAIFASALYFAVFHANVPQGIYAFIVGVILAWVRYRCQTIIAPVLFHVIANITSIILTYMGFLEHADTFVYAVICIVSLVVLGGILWMIHKEIDRVNMDEKYDTIIVGAGFAGAVVARELAERGKERVLVIDKRNHIGGNCYDSLDEHGILVHNYGPHIFHTNMKNVYDYLSRFTKWYNYRHEVGANIYGNIVPVPFNLNTLHASFEEEVAIKLEKQLIDKYGEGAKVPILELMQSEDDDIKSLGQYVYENIFLTYTMKQWGQKPEEIDPSVTARVPVVLSRDDRYFQDEYQGMPLDGYTPLFEKLLKHSRITVKTGVDAKEVLRLNKGQVYYEGEPFAGKVIFTGPIDEFFNLKYGALPYRSLRFEWEHFADTDSYQPKAVINYTVSEPYTRVTEFKKLTGQEIGGTTIIKEYSIPYKDRENETPYYAILNDANRAVYNKYCKLLKEYNNFYLLGRLAEYKYYNIDGIVGEALKLADKLLKEK
ncbi:MAG: UDP-galactopyranose mutase [Lachnospiraceae bacterium]|nr:UDP-galactopyranose mutase [Lachnospiraceae bacterium]